MSFQDPLIGTSILCTPKMGRPSVQLSLAANGCCHHCNFETDDEGKLLAHVVNNHLKRDKHINATSHSCWLCESDFTMSEIRDRHFQESHMKYVIIETKQSCVNLQIPNADDQIDRENGAASAVRKRKCPERKNSAHVIKFAKARSAQKLDNLDPVYFDGNNKENQQERLIVEEGSREMKEGGDMKNEVPVATGKTLLEQKRIEWRKRKGLTGLAIAWKTNSLGFAVIETRFELDSLDHHDNIYPCYICKQPVCESELLGHLEANHSSMWTSDGIYECRLCCECFPARSLILKHAQDVHGAKGKCSSFFQKCVTSRYTCPCCHIVKLRHDLMKYHVLNNCQHYLYQCHLCGDLRKNPDALRKHIRRTHEGRR